MVVVAVKSGLDSETLNQLKKIGIRHDVDLEEDGLGAGQHGVGGDILKEHLSELTGGMVHHVPIHEIAVGVWSRTGGQGTCKAMTN